MVTAIKSFFASYWGKRVLKALLYGAGAFVFVYLAFLFLSFLANLFIAALIALSPIIIFGLIAGPKAQKAMKRALEAFFQVIFMIFGGAIKALLPEDKKKKKKKDKKDDEEEEEDD